MQRPRSWPGARSWKTFARAWRSPATYHRWSEQSGGADVNTVKELKAVKEENARRKRLVAEQALDLAALKELAEGKW
jgi:putative transposase